MEELKFSLKRKELPIVLEDVSGVEKRFVLREFSSRDFTTYLSDMGERVKMHDGKVVGLNSYEGVQTKLISLCLFDEEGKSVKVSVIDEFPASVVNALFNGAQELNGLGEKGEAKVKAESKNG